jgi:predicted MPP superfamily phosphohydrolase
MTRRRFLTVTAGTLAVGVLGGVTGDALAEARKIEIHPFDILLENLPCEFNGLRIALLTDLHHGYFISREYIAKAVRLTNSLQADLVFLTGDYIHDDPAYITPVMEELGNLQAPLGVFAVQGNRDIRVNRMMVSQEMARTDIKELTNKGTWIHRGNSRIWLCGIDDCTLGQPDETAALHGALHDTTVLALTHNPHYADFLVDPRIRLLLCGHTHGGQINLPIIGRPFLPEGCEKYPCGLVQGIRSKVFISTGIGSIFPPLRFRCPPEIALLTLVASCREISFRE